MLTAEKLGGLLKSVAEEKAAEREEGVDAVVVPALAAGLGSPSSRQRPRGADFAEEGLCELPRRRSEASKGLYSSKGTILPSLRLHAPPFVDAAPG